MRLDLQAEFLSTDRFFSLLSLFRSGQLIPLSVSFTHRHDVEGNGRNSVAILITGEAYAVSCSWIIVMTNICEGEINTVASQSTKFLVRLWLGPLVQCNNITSWTVPAGIGLIKWCSGSLACCWISSVEWERTWWDEAHMLIRSWMCDPELFSVQKKSAVLKKNLSRGVEEVSNNGMAYWGHVNS
jgi:hypothetical protein